MSLYPKIFFKKFELLKEENLTFFSEATNKTNQSTEKIIIRYRQCFPKYFKQIETCLSNKM